MSKELEALEHLLNTYAEDCNNNVDNIKKTYRITIGIIEKSLKALEIIKEKPQIEIVHIQWGKIKTYDEYLKRIYEWDLEYGDMILTQEEYDLLKEVLL